MASMSTGVGSGVGRLGRRAWAVVPKVHGTRCRVCGYEVPALGLPPDWELAWFERFEGRPCPNCCGLVIGAALGALLVGALRRFAEPPVT